MQIALGVAGVWLAILTATLLLVVRQIGLITLRFEIAGQPARLPSDGLGIGTAVPDEMRVHFPAMADELFYVILLSPSCAPCRDLAPSLAGAVPEQDVFVLVPGDYEHADELIRLLPTTFEVVRDPAATEVARGLELERTPFAIEIDRSIVTGKAFLFDAEGFRNLYEARAHSDAADIATFALEAR